VAAFNTERVTGVRHWNEFLFSFTTTRDAGLRFENGQFIMIGLSVDNRPLLRAYSIASPNYEEHLEFFSIKVPDGPLTSRLQHLKVGDEILIGSKPTGTLLLNDLKPGRNLFLLSTGTGLAPFLAILGDPDTWERFDKVIVVHGVRHVDDLAYRDHFEKVLPAHEYFGDVVREKFIYYPTVTREAFRNQGRIDQLLDSGKLCADIGLPPLNAATDRIMICGSPAMLKSISELLDSRGFQVSPRIGTPGDYVIERAFVDR
jgi:ferredoxin/flavodoxin---NADP+ reductase